MNQLDDLKNTDLLRLWAKVMTALRDREVIRSSNNPVGDYCERLVAYHYDAELETNSQAGYDLVVDGQRIQVKGRRRIEHSSPSHYSVFRGIDQKKFDVFIAVHLNEDFTVDSAWTMPWRAVKRISREAGYVAGHRLPIIQGALCDDKDVEALELKIVPGD